MKGELFCFPDKLHFLTFLIHTSHLTFHTSFPSLTFGRKMHFYLAIILYILSVVAGVIAMIAVKNISPSKFLMGVAVHLIFILLFLFMLFARKQPSAYPSFFNLSFLFFICSGIILFGLTWQSKTALLLRIYFALFACTILLFVFSPSRMINFLLTQRYADTLGQVFSVGEDYFIEEQSSSMRVDTSIAHYKLIKKHGLFHETIQRDLLFNGNLDSIHVLQFISGEKMLIRAFTSKETYVSNEIDSMDVEVKLIKQKYDQIERKL